MAWLTPLGARGPVLVSNTIADNFALAASAASGVVANGFDGDAMFVNNIIVAYVGQTAIHFPTSNDHEVPMFSFNNVFSDGGAAFTGQCCYPVGVGGNLSVAPLFSDPANGDFSLSKDSPLIDMGDNTVPGLPLFDLIGNPRVFDGNGDDVAIIDMGAFEVVPEPSSISVLLIGACILGCQRRRVVRG